MPALVRQGYPERFSMGLIAGTGSVGLLFPPALPLFIYGTVYGLTNLEPELWDTRRFLFAGIVPDVIAGAVLTAAGTTLPLPELPLDPLLGAGSPVVAEVVEQLAVGARYANFLHPALDGRKLLVIAPRRWYAPAHPTAGHLIAVDPVGAGIGEEVVVCMGDPARRILGSTSFPVEAAVAAIVDSVEMGEDAGP